jgi:hypothetical protein
MLVLRLRRSIIRWARVLALAVLGAVVFELILPRAWALVRWTTPQYSPPFIALVTWLVTLILFYALCEPIRVRRRQWSRLFWYPPIWLAMGLAWGLAAASENLPSSVRPQTTGPDWQHAYPVIPIVMAFVISILLRQLPWRSRAAHGMPSASNDEFRLTWRELEEWIDAGERPVASGERDLFRHRAVAIRIAQLAGGEGRPVALLGEFGTGKSSILNAVRAELDRITPTVIVADCDVWAVPRPEDVPRLALNRLVGALDDYVDTIEFRQLPLSYQRLAAAEPTGRLAGILGLGSATDSVEEIERLSPILEALNARIVLIVEDVERTGREFDTRHLQRLLWALRKVPRSSFILAVDPRETRLDFAKLCDTIELVPTLDVAHVESMLIVAYGHWMSEFSDIDPHPDRSSGKLGLEQVHIGGMADYIRRTGRGTPLDAMVSLLQTPRSLKHVLRRVDQTWRHLHGEAELDDILIVSALRHGAEPVYKFLLTDIDAARHEPDSILPRTNAVKDAWVKLIEGLSNGVAAQQLVDLMGIKQLTKGRAFNITDAPQGVHNREPVDYFRRIVAEELSPSELRDQDALRDIENWKAGAATSLVDKLVAASDDDERYPNLWEHFSFRHTNAELMRLTAQVAAGILERDKASAEGQHPALIALWRRCNRRLEGNHHTDWLRQLILDGVPVSLSFVTDMFYYWTGDRGITNGAARASIRQSIVDDLHNTIRNGADLARVLWKDRPYTILRLITQSGEQTAPAMFAEWRDFIAPLLIEGGNIDPETIIPELSNLVGDAESGIVAAKDQYPPIFANRYRLDRERMSALFGPSLDEALALLADYDGDNAYALRSKDEAQKWREES